MKKIVKYIVLFFIRCFNLVYSYVNYQKFKSNINTIYSYWISLSINYCGNNFSIRKPAFFKGMQYMSIGEGFNAGDRLRIECWDRYAGELFHPVLSIGKNVSMNNNVHIGCINNIKIGNNVLFASNIYISDHHHGFINNRDLSIAPAKRQLYSKGPVVISDNVWIGENVAIMPNVTIGKGCIIGANSVVTKNFPENSIVAGVPARIIKTIE